MSFYLTNTERCLRAWSVERLYLGRGRASIELLSCKTPHTRFDWKIDYNSLPLSEMEHRFIERRPGLGANNVIGSAVEQERNLDLFISQQASQVKE